MWRWGGPQSKNHNPLVANALTNFVEVGKGLVQALEVPTAVVLQVVLLKEGADTGVELHKLVLGHGGEEVVLDLVVEVAHPPVSEEMGGDVDGVVGAVLGPVDVLVGIEDIEVGMGKSKVDEDVGGSEGVHQEVCTDGLSN